MNPSALFAAQYAEAIKLRKGVDPVLEFYEDLRLAFLNNNPKEFNSAVASIKKASVDRAPEQVDKILFEKSYNKFEPFYRSSLAYILIFASACLSWLCLAGKSENFNPENSNYYKILLTTSPSLHSLGIHSDCLEECILKEDHRSQTSIPPHCL